MSQVEFKPIKLIKASAGAGKTHFLTGEYIDMILSGDVDSYRHILAVTFTNKATEEMKSRVIERLHEIACDKTNSKHDKAKERLTRILHDYSHFSISTIDTFFQSVIRSFAREIGQYASYRVELDTGSVVGQTIDLLLDSLAEDSNKELYEWLKDYSIKRIEDGESWDISKPLEEMANLFFKEDFKLKFREGEYAIRSREATEAFSHDVSKCLNDFRRGVTERTDKVFSTLQKYNLDILSDFKGKSRGAMTIFNKWRNGDYGAVPKDEIMDTVKRLDNDKLTAEVADAVYFHESGRDDYNTAKLLMDNIHLLGVYSDIYSLLNGYLKENNVILLGESTDLLCRIIDGNDTPFIYEKVGTRYDHIMLDEAQDTSLLQWKNFMPLFKENVASGRSNLVVGDIKQSIYRWRGSDWRLISDYIYDDLGKLNIDDSKSLDENWRSTSSIVDFNYLIYSKLADTLKATEPTVSDKIGEIYSGCKQTIPEEHSGYPEGHVKLSFIDDEEICDRVIKRIGELTEAGYELKDISILTRKNSQSAQIADCLIKNGIGVITDDSLLMKSSPCISRIMDILRYSVNPDDQVGKLLVSSYGDSDFEIPEGSLYSICESLLSSEKIEVTQGDIPFIHAFLDSTLDFQQKYGSSVRGLVKWWDETGSTKSISTPDGQNAVRVMTIHKAKGLSLEAVIVPYFEFRYMPTSLLPTVWCKTKGKFSDIGLVPLKATKSLVGTSFENDYTKEKIYSYIDNVNLAYVATTRAKSSLTILAKKPDDSRNSADKMLSVAHSFYDILKKQLDENYEYESGTLEFHGKDESSDNIRQIPQTTFSTTPVGSRLQVKMLGQDYFEEEVSPRLRGIELHKVLENCNCAEDLPHAVESCVADGSLPSKDGENALRLLGEAFSSLEKQGFGWFGTEVETLNEVSIVDKEGTAHRPDRIIVDEKTNSATVIDFKFGRNRDKYNKQVAEYCSLLEEIGYLNVEGYLWFPASGIVAKVPRG